MRKILYLTSIGLQLLARCGQGTKLPLAALLVTMCCSAAVQAQTSRQMVAPAAMSFGDNAVSSAVAYRPDAKRSEAAVDAAYSILDDDSTVQQASLSSRGRAAYCKPNVNPCYAGCDVSLYVNYEALWLTRTGDDFFSLSRNTFLPDWDYEFGGRYTLGHLFDCVNGVEVSYVGPYDWQRTATVAGNANLDSQLFATNGYVAANVDSFNNADFHGQTWRARLDSYEINQRWWVWDVLSTLIGVRYIDYEEDFAFLSLGQNGGGFLQENVDNEMLGLQIGADVIYPMTMRSNTAIRGKAGVYANSHDRRSFVINDGTVLINSGDSTVDVAGVFELGFYTNYHIVPSIRLTAGYEFWWMTGMATVPEQRPSLITPSSGTTVFNDDDVFLHGGSVGVQVLF